MNKQTIKILLIVVISGLLIYGGYWIYDMFQFAKGVKEDTPKFVENLLKSEIQNGDIIFQTSTSGQSKAIQIATGSKYSHMGIIYKQGNDFFVYEAVQPVKQTPINEWINRGENAHFVVKRIKNSEKLLTPETLTKMKQIGEKYAGKDYDLYFEWSDSRIYCSELVWKIYKKAVGLEIGELEKLGDFNITDKAVKQKLIERYGDNIPKEELVISPASMFNSNNLITVFRN
ncbi:YiiX family permuted papain-like enzyme [Marinilabilia salmonicolor]|uniref:Permuted papain-like amidase YaeF/Yiix C92 family enzyme n=1 Tax=Marinilabilia salmonicolor TaxID=989 RepID=A0A368UIT9_9BACT|nr:YiiX family permuted papain-like enzyme [Marinilabilia salmonicolor]RCW21036.1 permuted papain-like amidase YaeF/Yiix C92 family enzyme [Marinilabilia salmonicolor]